jgi:hypothetical protein
MRELYNLIFSLPPRSFTIVSIIFGFILIDDLDGYEQNALGDFILSVGQVLITNASKIFLDENNNLEMKLQEMRREIEILKSMVNERK